MPKEIYDWFIQHPDVRVESFYDEIFNHLHIRMVFWCLRSEYMIEDFKIIDDTNKLLVLLDHLYSELIKHKESED